MKHCCPQEISADILSAVGKQTLRGNALKFLRVTEMPHIYAKYNCDFTATEGSPKVFAQKLTSWIKLSHIKQKIMEVRVKDKDMDSFSFLAFLQS